jgi:hypothetical protein
MKRTLFFLLICSSFSAFGQNKITTSKTTFRNYRGTIGPYTVHLSLADHDGKVSGEFDYSPEGPEIILSGTSDNLKLQLKESYSKLIWPDIKDEDLNITQGDFNGVMDGSGNISGSVKAGSKEPYSVSLNRVFEVNTVDSTLDAVYMNTDPRYKTDKVYALQMKEIQFLDLPNHRMQKDLNSLYAYRIISYLNKTGVKDLNLIPEKKFAEFGYPSGKDLLAQNAKIKNPGFPYDFKNSYKVTYLNQYVMSVENYVEEYNGAPHLFNRIYYDNYNMFTGKAINLSDILIPWGKTYLDSIGDICFRQQMNLGPYADLKTSGYIWPDNQFHANTTFYFSQAGLYFVYNQYEINSYSEGIVKVLIPYKMLKPIIRADGPLAWARE